MVIFRIFILGLTFLAIILLVNILLGYLGFINWYQLIEDSSEATVYDYVWLLVTYPFILGLVAYFLAGRISKK